MEEKTALINAGEVKEAMKAKRFRQADLIELLYAKGINAPPSSVSLALSGKCSAPRFQRILKGIQEILEES